MAIQVTYYATKQNSNNKVRILKPNLQTGTTDAKHVMVYIAQYISWVLSTKGATVLRVLIW